MDKIDDFCGARFTSSGSGVGARKVDRLAISEEAAGKKEVVKVGGCTLQAVRIHWGGNKDSEAGLKVLFQASERG